jgi:hypothetical protein
MNHETEEVEGSSKRVANERSRQTCQAIARPFNHASIEAEYCSQHSLDLSSDGYTAVADGDPRHFHGCQEKKGGDGVQTYSYTMYKSKLPSILSTI